MALQLKLNELLAAQVGASNHLINVEELSEAEVRALHERYQQLAARLRSQPPGNESHSIDETARAR